MRMMGALEARGGLVFPGKACTGVENRLADGLTRWKVDQIPERLYAECAEVARQVQDVFGDMARGCAFGRVAGSTRRLTRRIEECG